MTINDFPIIRQYEDIYMIQVRGMHHIVKLINGDHVRSFVPYDRPKKGGTWTAPLTPEGIKSISQGRSKIAADYHWKRYVAR